MVVLKRSTMMLYSGSLDIDSHKVRFVLAEKGVAFDVLYVDINQLPEDLLSVNPYHSVPTLVDRDLVLYEPDVICEYLDERFPHPPLLPVYPIARAKCRLMLHRIKRDWLSLLPIIQAGEPNEADVARKTLQDHFISLAPVFAEMPYFLSEDFTLVDCCIAPMLWRLQGLVEELPVKAKPVKDYAARIFARESFQASLSELEREL